MQSLDFRERAKLKSSPIVTNFFFSPSLLFLSDDPSLDDGTVTASSFLAVLLSTVTPSSSSAIMDVCWCALFYGCWCSDDAGLMVMGCLFSWDAAFAVKVSMLCVTYIPGSSPLALSLPRQMRAAMLLPFPRLPFLVDRPAEREACIIAVVSVRLPCEVKVGNDQNRNCDAACTVQYPPGKVQGPLRCYRVLTI